jgi:hypothetical protein
VELGDEAAGGLYRDVVDEGLREEGGVPSRSEFELKTPVAAGGEEYA